jgi:arylsulfatase A-like enzyme
LRDLAVAENTLVWFCSDNGGLPKITPETVGGLRGFKGSVYEGGLRVPAIIEWPAGITAARITSFPSCTMDIFPTVAEVCGLPASAMVTPQDGTSLLELFQHELTRRSNPIPFRHTRRAAFLDNQFKLITQNTAKGEYELYDLANDPQEKQNIFSKRPDLARRLRKSFEAWNASVENSVAGQDFPEGAIIPGESEPRTWTEMSEYEPYFDAWKERPEYRSRFRE